jgi:hypothetical protein
MKRLRAVWATIAAFAVLTVWCGGSARASGGAFVAPPEPTPQPTDMSWPNYLALDYRERGQPGLTPRQAASLREMLARVKPCQRRFVRYAFTTAATGRQFVMFFGPFQGGVEPHVLGAKNLYYNPREGLSFPMPGEPVDYSVRADSIQLGCPAGDLITKWRN